MKRKDFRKNRSFTRRAMVIGLAQSTLALILVSRLGYLQLFKYKQFAIQSDKNRIKPIIKPAPRGVIFDRNQVPLAESKDSYSLFFYTENKKNISDLLKDVVATLELDQSTYDDFLAKIKNSKRRSIISLMDNLSWDDVARIEANSYKLQGISIESTIIRKYPFPFETAHFIGFVSLPSEKEIKKDGESELYMHPDFRIGKTGVEKTFDSYLRGRYGVKEVEVNAFDIPIRTLNTRPYTKGKDLNLTIDIGLQKFTTERIKDVVASVVVMDIKTGEILTMASSPSFDPNNFVEGISREYWNELYLDLRKPMTNKPISAIYPPGSTFKLMTALAGLKDNINPYNTVHCPGYYQYGNRRFHCWKKEGHGTLNLLGAIEQSCNTYFFTLGNRLGIDKMAEIARKFGYGERFNIGLQGVMRGNIPNDEWKRKFFNQPWVGGDNLNTAIGQGFVLASPLQMAVIVSRIANGAIPIKPYLIKNRAALTQFKNLSANPLVPKEHLQWVLDGMNEVVNGDMGTASLRRIKEKGFEMAGKTGTSQVISKREDELTREEKKLNVNQNHAIFIGFAPVSNPKYGISVAVEHGISGSAGAAPIGRDVLLYAQQNLR